MAARYNCVLLKGDTGRRYEEARASVITKPAFLLERLANDGSGRRQVRPHTSRGGRHERMVAIEDALIGRTINDAYAIGELVRCIHLSVGEEFQGVLKRFENVGVGDWLVSSGDGGLVKQGAATFVNTVADSTAITNTVSETTFSNGTFVIPKNSVNVGDVIRFSGQVAFPSTNSTDTATLKLYLGATQLFTTGALDVANGDVITFEGRIVIRTVGATGTYIAYGTYNIGVPGTATSRAWALAETVGDFTADQTVAAKLTWSVANAANQAILRSFTGDSVNAGSNLSAGPTDETVASVSDAIDLSAAPADDFVICQAV